MSELESSIKAANSIAALIDKIIDKVLNIKDRVQRAKEIERLHHLLETVRISRTLNQGLFYYVRTCLHGNKEKADNELSIMLDQIEASLKALVSILEEIAEEMDRVIIYKNEDFQTLSLLLADRQRLLDSLRQHDEESLENIMNSYEDVSHRIGLASYSLAKFGKDLDNSLK